MTKTTSRHLLNILAEVPDFRNDRGKRHQSYSVFGFLPFSSENRERESTPTEETLSVEERL